MPRCRPSVGFRQTARHAALADLLRDLGGDGDLLALELDVHLERVVDLRQRVGRELDVDDGTDDRDDPPVLEGFGLWVRRLRSWQLVLPGFQAVLS